MAHGPRAALGLPPVSLEAGRRRRHHRSSTPRRASRSRPTFFESKSVNSAFLGATLLGKATRGPRRGTVRSSQRKGGRLGGTCAPALLALEDGTVFSGIACGAAGEAAGELCFNTSMSGYQEVLTDPSYAGQIVTMTMPHIGNYGVNGADMESRGVFAKGFVVREMCDEPSSWRSEESLPDVPRARAASSPSRASTRGASPGTCASAARCARSSRRPTSTRASLVAKAAASPGLVGRDLVAEVATTERVPLGLRGAARLRAAGRHRRPARSRRATASWRWTRASSTTSCAGSPRRAATSRVAAADRHRRGGPRARARTASSSPTARATRRPSTTCTRTLASCSAVKPVFGICLGHQMLSLAVGRRDVQAQVRSPRRQPAGQEPAHRPVEITSQNHGFCVDFGSIGELDARGERRARRSTASDLGAWVARGRRAGRARRERFGRVQLTHVNLNDMTIEGIRLLDVPAFSVQYHPEAAPGPHDARYLFGAFMRLMDGRSDYLSPVGVGERTPHAYQHDARPGESGPARGRRSCGTCAGCRCSRCSSVLVVTAVDASGMEAPVLAAEVDRARERLAAMAAAAARTARMDVRGARRHRRPAPRRSWRSRSRPTSTSSAAARRASRSSTRCSRARSPRSCSRRARSAR